MFERRCWIDPCSSAVDHLLGHVRIGHALHIHRHVDTLVTTALEPWLHRLFFAPLLLFLQLLYHVVAYLFLLRVEDLQAILHRHLPLQVMPLAEKLRVFFFAA